MMHKLLWCIEAMLRAGTRPFPLRATLPILGLGGLIYGAVMGSYGGWLGERWLQVIYSGLKVPMLLAVTTAIALPSFCVLNTLLGLRADLGQAIRAVVGAQGMIALVLASLAPFTAVWYATTQDYYESILFNAMMFATASITAQVVLRRQYRPLMAREPRHRWMLFVWWCLYSFIGIQMAWVLRPFVGYPGMNPTFLRPEAWGNAYIVIGETIWKVLSRM
jgi:hypothetical protein